jgi:WD40 repeat protein
LREHLERCPACRAVCDRLSDNPSLRRWADGLAQAATLTGAYRPRERAEDLPTAPASSPNAPPPAIPGYDILDVLGSGGMGVVYRAHQHNLNRAVALKMIRPGEHPGGEAVARFRAEAEAVGRLLHPNIVQIYELGEHEGCPYFSLEFVAGGTLAGKLAGEPQPARPAAALVEALARAVHYAHERGIVHRDLKPANVLLQPDPGGGFGVPKIADFGLAKQTDTDSGQTRSGAILGTPSYMAPEQASGRSSAVGPAADVYALGAILYDVLTGRPPFHGPTLLDTLEQVRAREPVPTTQLQPGVPRDLETICLKCLHKQPAGRYASAAELADDLRRFTAGEPIRARPVSAREKAWRWCRRNPWLAGLGGALAAAVVVAVILPTVLLMRLQAAVTAKDDALGQKDEALAAQEAALVDSYAAAGHMANDRGRPGEAMLWFATAAQTSEKDPERRELNNLRVRTWGRSLWTPARVLPHPGQTLTRFAFHPRGTHLVTHARGNRCVVWDLATESPLPLPQMPAAVVDACWSAKGDLWAVAHPGGVELRDFPAGAVRDRLPDSIGTRVLAFDPDGRFLAVGGDRLRLWDCTNRRWLPGTADHPKPVVSVRFAARAGLVATGADDNLARVFAWTDTALAETPLFSPATHYSSASMGLYGSGPGRRGFWPDRYFTPLFTANDRDLVSHAGTAWRSLNARTGQLVASAKAEGGTIMVLCLSPDGKHLVYCGYELQARIWDVAKKAVTGFPPPHGPWALTAAFSPDSRQLVIAGMDQWARICSVPDGRLLHQIFVGEEVWDVAYAPDGWSLATSSPSGLVRVWSAPPAVASLQVPALFTGECSSAAISPDGRYVLPRTHTEATAQARVYDLATGEPVGAPLPYTGRIMSACFSADGGRVAFADYVDPWKGRPHAGSLQVWDWRQGQRVFAPVSLTPMPTKPTGVALNPNGKQVVVTGEYNTTTGEDAWVLVIDAATGAVRHRLRHENRPALIHHWQRRVLFAPDGRTFVTAGVGLAAQVWDAEAGNLRYPPLLHEQGCVDLDISPDGALLLTASQDGTARLWDLATGKPNGRPLEHPNWVYQARFSRDGGSILTACRDRTARVWDVPTRQLVGAPMEHNAEVFSAAFSPDGRWVFTTTNAGTVGAWDRRTCKPVTPQLPLGEVASTIDVARGGRLVVASCLRNLRAWDWSAWSAPGPEEGPDARCRWAELLSLKTSVVGGGIVSLTPDEWLERWRDRRSRQPPSPSRGQ